MAAEKKGREKQKRTDSTDASNTPCLAAAVTEKPETGQVAKMNSERKVREKKKKKKIKDKRKCGRECTLSQYILARVTVSEREREREREAREKDRSYWT